MSIPAGMEGSAALQFVITRGWKWKPTTYPNIELETCPKCNKTGYGHLYMECRGSTDEFKQRDGLFMCQRCNFSGNLFTLKQFLGVVDPQISSQKDWSASEKKVDPLIDIDACHESLMADSDALDYLTNFRGFSLDIIQRQKIGIAQDIYFKGAGKLKALVYPYLVNGQAVWWHYRTCPDIKDLTKIQKAFSSPIGWESTLYNGEILKNGLKEVTLVEGEPNCIAAMDKGLNDICGVPGANIKKAEWIATMDSIGIEKVYICYDNDKVGQRAAQELASRIGIERCLKVVLPLFEVTPEDGITRKGKDLNEWFTHGGTIEQFEELKKNAVLFDVDGVSTAVDALDEFEAELEGKGAASKYVYPLFSDLAQFDEGDVIDFLAEEKVGKTTVGLDFMEYMVDHYQENGVIICLEMTRAKLARKWVSHKTGTPDNLPKSPAEAHALTMAFKEAIPKVKQMVANREGDLLLCYPKYSTVDDIYKLIIDCIRRYGVKWIMLDNLQRLCDTTLGANRNRTQYLSEISKKLSQIAKDYKIQMLRILQPHQIGEGRIVTTRDVDGASQVAKDCDVMFTFHRNKVGQPTKEQIEKGVFIKTQGSFAPEMYVSAGISRYSAGGSIEVYYDGATSTIHPMSVGKIQDMNKNVVVGYEGVSESLNVPFDNDKIPV